MTKRHAWGLFTIAAVSLGAWGLWFASADRGAAADIQKLADLVAKNDDVALRREAETIARKCKKLGVLMSLFKKRTEEGGGLGVGKKIGAIEPDGIEAKIQSLAKKAPSSAELEEQGDDLVRMTQVTANSPDRFRSSERWLGPE